LGVEVACVGLEAGGAVLAGMVSSQMRQMENPVKGSNITRSKGTKGKSELDLRLLQILNSASGWNRQFLECLTHG
jgi:hypothetical protein